ncbi:MAG: LptA/OstA family protein [Candidatus Stygibacter australis]|nr:LptA/OstA family protein [Candidatus Stygibacter australis]
MVNRNIPVILTVMIFCLMAGLRGEGKAELRPYRLIHADSLRANKVDGAYISELTGEVHFFYGDTEFFADKAFLYEREKIVRMTGNVKVYEDTLSLKAQRVSYFRLQEKLDLDEDVIFNETHQDSTWRTFNAERVEYLRESKNFEAWENVSVYDSRENVSGECGYMTYNVDKGFGYLKEEPELQMSKSDSILIKAERIEYYDDYKKIVAIFEVETEMPDYLLTSDFLIYYSEEEKATYRGQPKLFSEQFDAKASEVTLYFRENKLHQALMSDSCRVDYKVREFEAKENWVTSEEMEFIFENGVIKESRAYRSVDSYYVQQPDIIRRQKYLRNEASAEKLIMYMNEEGYIERIGLSKSIQGKYTFEGE